MNSGLQCLLATPTFVKYFTESYESSKDDTIGLPLTANFQVCNDFNSQFKKKKKSAICLHHMPMLFFQPVLKDVWAGDYSLLKPLTFNNQ